ncbi:hypothetical protein [Pseudomonas jinjuensis]|uniref:Uncharacterized protein n=1 Tax=Pseudomonas jinjuensis TaxID=198616 RepID=A0A1H0QI73_9PSED|nr:hypothetical protein [Pseudomonas jinjuensis]SDP17071.1 hypothetical protein SAMN05216193_12417 [Pseudomonas jinjuensis]
MNFIRHADPVEASLLAMLLASTTIASKLAPTGMQYRQAFYPETAV